MEYYELIVDFQEMCNNSTTVEIMPMAMYKLVPSVKQKE